MNRRVLCVLELSEFSLAVQHAAPVHQRQPGKPVARFCLKVAGDLRIQIGERTKFLHRDWPSKPGRRLVDQFVKGERLAGHEELAGQRAIGDSCLRRVSSSVGISGDSILSLPSPQR